MKIQLTLHCKLVTSLTLRRLITSRVQQNTVVLLDFCIYTDNSSGESIPAPPPPPPIPPPPPTPHIPPPPPTPTLRTDEGVGGEEVPGGLFSVDRSRGALQQLQHRLRSRMRVRGGEAATREGGRGKDEDGREKVDIRVRWHRY